MNVNILIVKGCFVLGDDLILFYEVLLLNAVSCSKEASHVHLDVQRRVSCNQLSLIGFAKETKFSERKKSDQ